MRLSAARSAFFNPKARAISRVPTLPDWLVTKARSSSFEGREGCFLECCEIKDGIRRQGSYEPYLVIVTGFRHVSRWRDMGSYSAALPLRARFGFASAAALVAVLVAALAAALALGAALAA